MRKKLSVYTAVLFVLALSVLAGCSHFFIRDENKKFESYTDALFCSEVSANTISLHYTLQDPKKYGITNVPVSFAEYTTDAAEVSASLENTLAGLHKIKPARLTGENRLTYQVLENHLETSLAGAKYTLYEEPLGPITGIQSQLPVLLSEFKLHSKEDVKTYLALLKEVPKYFDSLIDFETAKSSAGLFMAGYTADSIINECNSFQLMGKENYLFSSFKSRIGQMKGLSKEQKKAYIALNEEYVTAYVFPSYEKLKAALSSLRTTGKNNNGLCYLPDGAAYYEQLVNQQTGSNRSITQLQDLTHKQMIEDLSVMQEILTSYAQTTDSQSQNTFQDAASVTFEESDPISIIDNLKTCILDTFPAPPKVSTEVKYVQKEMEEFLSPAFYMVPPIDNTKNNIIYINQAHMPDDLELFSTIAHESYPGHLYQTVYYAAKNNDPIRKILSCQGYVEGWATYAEMISYYYTPLPKDQATLLQRNDSVILGLYALADMGIHYDGWTLLDTVSFFRQYGISSSESIEKIYDIIVSDPGNYLKYYIGYVEFLELKKEAIDSWGKDFTQKKFHQAVLDAGPAPFEIVREYMLKSGAQNKK